MHPQLQRQPGMISVNKETLKDLAANPDFISGIYNYCDRWCERCPFTTRCMNFALGREEFPDDASRDVRNAEFWEGISGMLQATIELLYEMAEERGIDLDAVDTTAIMAEEERQREVAQAHPCAAASKAYADSVDNWFAAAGDLFRQKGEALATALRLNLTDVDPGAETNRLSDAVAVIRWHQFQIHVRLMRALQGRHDEENLADVLEGFPKDSDGSAKVALIGIDRSIAAWGKLLRDFPSRETETLEILVHLDRLRRVVEREFPEARAFVRPGFDFLDAWGWARGRGGSGSANGCPSPHSPTADLPKPATRGYNPTCSGG